MSAPTSPPKRIYLYGMALLSTIHKLGGGYPQEDTYGEIVDTQVVPGGEAANAALILAQFGLRAQLDGTCLGRLTREPLLRFLEMRGVDCSAMRYDAAFDGWRDVVLCAGASRTVFGWFRQLYSAEPALINEPSRAAIKAADLATIDPLRPSLSERAAQMCVETGTPFVSIDCGHDTLRAREAIAVVCSKEFLDQAYPGRAPAELLEAYRETCRGLVIFTFGAEPILFSDASQTGSVDTYPIEVVDTLAAGDSFRAGVVYAVAMGKPSREIALYGAATAALVCQRFPSIHPIPTLAEVEALVSEKL